MYLAITLLIYLENWTVTLTHIYIYFTLKGLVKLMFFFFHCASYVFFHITSSLLFYMFYFILNFVFVFFIVRKDLVVYLNLIVLNNP